MSTILDALKKSEQERKRNDLPTLADMPTPEEPSRWPLYIALLAVLLLLALLVFFFFRQGGDTMVEKPQEIVLSNDTVVNQGQTGQGDDFAVNVISYAEQAEQRFVMVNGTMFRQGEFVRAGLKVIEIKPDSVIFNLRGRRVERKP